MLIHFGSLLGQFYAPKQPEERVLSLSSDQLINNTLISGDTAGWLQIWDISQYAFDAQLEVSLCEGKKTTRMWAVRLHTPEILSFHTVRLWTASPAAVLEGSQQTVGGCGSPRGDRQTLDPHSLVWRFCWTVDDRRGSCRFLWTGSDVEHHRPSFLPEVTLMSLCLK